MKVLVAGASGFVGRRLCAALAEAGHNVVAMTRNPAGYAGTGRSVHGNVHDPATLGAAIAVPGRLLPRALAQRRGLRAQGCRRRRGIRRRAGAGLQQIIYLEARRRQGHAVGTLRSHREVELLGPAGVP
jgi:uncharacterized protein YbjT (DUF2867 family)